MCVQLQQQYNGWLDIKRASNIIGVNIIDNTN